MIHTENTLAIVGIGCRFPGDCNSPDEFWRLLKGGVDATGDVPVDRYDSKANGIKTRGGGFIKNITHFDPQVFGISPKDAKGIDPQQRMLLEVVWEAMEDAGRPIVEAEDNKKWGNNAGVFVGLMNNDYYVMQLNGGMSMIFYSISASPHQFVVCSRPNAHRNVTNVCHFRSNAHKCSWSRELRLRKQSVLCFQLKWAKLSCEYCLLFFSCRLAPCL